MAEIKDFTDHNENRQFRIDEDIFVCARSLPAGVARKLAQVAKKEGAEQFDVIAEMLDMLLLPESAQRFAARMTNPENPISAQQIGKVVEWMMEEFGGRPTKPAASSSESQTITGTSSMDGVQQEVSTL